MDWMTTIGSQKADQIVDMDHFTWGQDFNSTSGYGRKGGIAPYALSRDL